MSSPRDSITKILEYVSIKPNEERLSSIEETINPSRAFAFMNDPELLEFAEKNAETLEKHGY